MKLVAHKLSLTYVPAEDRIRWLCVDPRDTPLSVWVTRRHLLLMLPRLAAWLDGRGALRQVTAVPAALHGEVRTVEHHAAQQQVRAERGPVRDPGCAEEFLLHSFGIKTGQDDAVALALLAHDREQQVVLPASVPELHKLFRELLEIANAAGWSIPDPWPHQLGAPPAAAVLTRH